LFYLKESERQKPCKVATFKGGVGKMLESIGKPAHGIEFGRWSTSTHPEQCKIHYKPRERRKREREREREVRRKNSERI